jgi:hypothetical protein
MDTELLRDTRDTTTIPNPDTPIIMVWIRGIQQLSPIWYSYYYGKDTRDTTTIPNPDTPIIMVRIRGIQQLSPIRILLLFGRPDTIDTRRIGILRIFGYNSYP